MRKKRRTKIIATIGPASGELKTIKAMLRAGASVFRFNLKHGSPEEHLKLVRRAQSAIDKSGKKGEILLDFPVFNFVPGFELAQELVPEYVALSHIGSPEEVELVRENLKLAKVRAKLVTKIETEDALKNFSSILDAAEAIMIARGDLGRAVKLEYVPIAQKEIIQACNDQKKFVVVATEMLLSMTKNKLPTRAEAGDVANAVIEGADAVMLSEETAVGHNPVEAVKVMSRIIEVAEYWQRKGHISVVSESGKKFDFGR